MRYPARLLFPFFLPAFICFFLSPAVGKEVFPFPIRQTVLANGLKIVGVPYDSPGVVAFLTIVRAGSRNEVEEGCSGFAHFFEHMMFKGTKKYSSSAREKVLMLRGAESNAFTSDDFTCYHVVGSANALEKIMEIESDRFLNLDYDESELKTEATVILGEYQKSASNPFLMLEEKLRDNAFTRHPYKHTVIGFLRDIRAMPEKLEYSRLFFRRSYGPENCTVLVVGDFVWDKLLKSAGKFYAKWPARRDDASPRPEPAQTVEKKAHIDWNNETLPFVYLGYHVPAFSAGNTDIPALEVLSHLVFSTTSPLYKKLVLDEQKVEFVAGQYEKHRDPFLFTIISRVKKAEDLDYVRITILDALDAAARNPISPEKLADIKSQIRYSFAMGLDTPQGVAFALADFIALTGNPDSINFYYSSLEKITSEDVTRVARRYFSSRNRTTVTLVRATNGTSLEDATGGKK